MPLEEANSNVELDLIETAATLTDEGSTYTSTLIESEKTLHVVHNNGSAGVSHAAGDNVNLSKKIIQSLFPILSWLPNYKIGKFLFGDLIAGLTVSVLQVPHGLAFAPLGGQPAVCGLYMAILPICIYTILGTSPHISLGMQAIVVMMVGKLVETYSISDESINISLNSSLPVYTALEVGIAATFTIGAWQLLLGVLQFGSLCVLLSSSVVSAFTCGAAIHIIFVQLKHIFGIPLVMAPGPMKLYFLTVNLLHGIPLTNVFVFLISAIFIVILYVFNDYIKHKIAKRFPIPIPMEFILVLAGVALSTIFDLKSVEVATVGPVPGELPAFMVPPFSLVPTIAFDCLIIALVNISLNIALAKIFAKKGGYAIDDNQELVAYGVSNIFGGFFQCLPVCAAISRSMIQYSVGGKTQLAHAVSLLSVLTMLLFLGFMFEMVPLSVLAAICVVNMKPLIVQMKDIPNVWRQSKRDGLVWIVTFLSVILLDIDYGIGIGLLSSFISLLVTNLDIELQHIGKVSGKDCFLDFRTYKSAEVNSRVSIFKVIGNINFYNGPLITKKILKNFGSTSITFVIIDFSCVPNIDLSGVECLLVLRKTLNANKCDLVLASCTKSVASTLRKSYPDFYKDTTRASVKDAVTYIDEKYL